VDEARLLEDRGSTDSRELVPLTRADGGNPSVDSESARAADALAEEAARVLRLAASAAEALAPRLPGALRRADLAEAEAARLRAALEAAEARIEKLEKMQAQLSEGFIREIRQRDAEIATLRAAATATGDRWPGTSAAAEVFGATSAPGAAMECEAQIEVITFTAEGALGIEFDDSNACLKLVAAVEPGSQASACLLAAGDEVVSVSGVPARNISWEELEESLSTRPVVVSVRRADPSIGSPGGGDPAQGGGGAPRGGLAQHFAKVAGYARAAAAQVQAALNDAEEPNRWRSEDEPQPDDLPSEVRNRPFYELVRSSMAEACVAEGRDFGDLSQREDDFEGWLRLFHSERDDEWYANNHERVYNAFRPHWDEVLAAQRALAAS